MATRFVLTYCAAILCVGLFTSCADPIPESASRADEPQELTTSEVERQHSEPDTSLVDTEALRIVVLMTDIELTYESTILLLAEYTDSGYPRSFRDNTAAALDVARNRIDLLIQMLQGWSGQLFEEKPGGYQLRNARNRLLEQLREFTLCLSVMVSGNPDMERPRCDNDVNGAIDTMYRALWSAPDEQASSALLFPIHSTERQLLIDVYLIKRYLLESCFVTACYGSTKSNSGDANALPKLVFVTNVTQTQAKMFEGASVILRDEQCRQRVLHAERPMLRLVELWADEMERLWKPRDDSNQVTTRFRFSDNEIAYQAMRTYEDILLSCLMS